MRSRTIVSLGLSVLLITAAAFVWVPERSDTQMAVKKLTVKKISGVWKVVDENNNTNIRVDKNQMVRWESDDKDVDLVFQFPAEYSIYFTPDRNSDRFPDGYTKFLEGNKKLRLKVKGDAPSDTLVYAVFVIGDNVFAQGDSPPRMVVN